MGGVYIGPGDLALGLGLSPFEGFSGGQLEPAIRRIIAVCREHELIVGAHANSVDNARLWLSLGVQLITLGSERGLMNWAAQALKASVLDGPPPLPSAFLYY